jgi:ABC-type dipeptide/oligopeptide/nickel transport system permease component
VVERLRRDLGLDRPMLGQYTAYLGRLLRGDLGDSIFTRRPVTTEIGSRFWNTVKLSLSAIALASVVGVALGTLSAINRGRAWDHAASVVALLGISIPVFWLGLLLMYLFGLVLGLLPTAGDQTWRHYVLPTITLSVFSLAFIARMTRSSLLETIGQDYVRTARAKGVSERGVLVRHALRNALLPIVTVVGLRFGYMLGGAVITEQVFAWPGMGRLLVTAVSQRDIPVVQGVLLVFAASFVLVNLAVDLAYGFVDPRIRHR